MRSAKFMIIATAKYTRIHLMPLTFMLPFNLHIYSSIIAPLSRSATSGSARLWSWRFSFDPGYSAQPLGPFDSMSVSRILYESFYYLYANERVSILVLLDTQVIYIQRADINADITITTRDARIEDYCLNIAASLAKKHRSMLTRRSKKTRRKSNTNRGRKLIFLAIIYTTAYDLWELEHSR